MIAVHRDIIVACLDLFLKFKHPLISLLILLEAVLVYTGTCQLLKICGGALLV